MSNQTTNNDTPGNTTNTLTIGQFTLINSNTLEGPAEYMTQRGNQLVDDIIAGDDTVFNMTSHLSRSPEIAVLVRLQTDFAGWIGTQRLADLVGVK